MTSRSASGVSGLGGSAGTDISLPSTPSQVTVSGRGTFSSMQFTINQTKDLVNQAVSVTWSGGTPTGSTTGGAFDGQFNNDFVQIFQCWGDPDTATVPSNPGPSTEGCEFGAEADPNVHPYPSDTAGFLTYSRVLAWDGWAGYAKYANLATSDPSKAYLDPNFGTGGLKAVVDPFDAVDGTTVPASVDHSYSAQPPPFPAHDTNPYFNHNDTNEIDFARTSGDGTGHEIFTVDTGLEAPGLGCGQLVQAHSDGSTSVPQCWLVIVPRGTAAQEDATADNTALMHQVVNSSPLSPSAWQNRIAIPLDFRSVGSSCSFGAQVRRIDGSELAAPAAASWQPALCGANSGSEFSYAGLPDDRDRDLIQAATSSGAGLAVFSRPIDPTLIDPSNPVVYAPLTLSGVVVAFNVERAPKVDNTGHFPTDEEPIAGERVTKINLTPRLVAKLLTESYRGQFVAMGATPPTGYSWLAKNPVTLIDDPDFLQYNPEFTELSAPNGRDSGNLVVEQPSSDSANEVWQWILADPEAKAWLDGQPDAWGMKVNPFYSPASAINPGEFAKSDPYCAQTNADLTVDGKVARNLCFLDWAPYVLSMHDAAAATRSTNTGAKTVFNPGASSPDLAWGADGPLTQGAYSVLSITDSADAARFGLQTAMLSRAGDDGTARQFVAADSTGLLSGEQAMTPSSVAEVLQGDPSTPNTGAYPLTMLTYAAVFPQNLDGAARTDYSKFVAFAAGTGQVSGLGIGNLPPGYAPLPAQLVSQAQAAAATILNPPAPPGSSTTTTSPPPAPSPPPPAPSPPPPAPAPAPAPAPPTVSPPPTVHTTPPPAPPVLVAASPASRPSASVPAPPTATLEPVAHTVPIGVGLVRFAVPFGLCAGLAAGAAAEVVGRRRRSAS
jgi:hypothetical protein